MSRDGSGKLKNDIIYVLILLCLRIARMIPRKAGLSLFGGIGSGVYLFPDRQKRRMHHNIRLILGDTLSGSERLALARKVYQMLGKNAFDALCLRNADDATFDAIVSYDSLDDFEQAYNLGRGVLVITAHLGCFEMLLPFFARKGFRSFAIGRRSYDRRIDQLILQNRTGDNFEYLHNRTQNMLSIVRKLKEGRAMGILVDQDLKSGGVFAHFLGRLALTPDMPIRIAMKYAVPAFVVTTHRTPDDRHEIRIGTRLQFATSGEFEHDLVRNVEMVNKRISAQIQEHPEQWVWMHNRWKRRPEHTRWRDALNIDTLASK
ncbi:MAG: hypothetical protein GF398_14960 [Chitinivibrionales bacterium]|nr:hypothetical protein [Chitinivibrionales bacterium]